MDGTEGRRFIGYAARRLGDHRRTWTYPGLPIHVVRFSNATRCEMDEPPGLETCEPCYTDIQLLTSDPMLLEHVASVADETYATRPYTVFAFFVYPVWFDVEGTHEGFHECVVETPPATPPSEAFQRVGFDLLQVEWYADVRGIGCSPLICNGCYADFPVNEECLLDTFEQALEAGKVFGATQPEPGDYLVIEVWRKRE